MRGSPAYFQRTFYDLLAMIRQLDIPTWFLTLSAADMRWPDVIQCIAKRYGTNLTEEDIRSMTYQEKSKWLSSNPVTAARHFHYRLNAFSQNVLKSSANPLGKVVDYAIRIEFQARGSPHAHTLIWIEGAPKYGIDSDQIICDFIEKYITCEIPDDEDFKEMVNFTSTTVIQHTAGNMVLVDSIFLSHLVLAHFWLLNLIVIHLKT